VEQKEGMILTTLSHGRKSDDNQRIAGTGTSKGKAVNKRRSIAK